MLVLVIGAPVGAAVMETTASAAPATSAVKVSITKSGFSPAVVVVPIGTNVQWKNNASVPHSLKGQVTSPTVLQPGATYERKFTTPGEYRYFDGTHVDSKGTVLVVAGSYKPPPEHGQPVTHLYSANLKLVVSENWTYYDGLGCQCTDPPCDSQTGSGSRVVSLSVLFPKVTYERFPAVHAEALYADDVPGHFGKTTETITSAIATDATPLLPDCGNRRTTVFGTSQASACLAWGPTSTKNTRHQRRTRDNARQLPGRDRRGARSPRREVLRPAAQPRWRRGGRLRLGADGRGDEDRGECDAGGTCLHGPAER